jgi:hypothetical protein
MQSLPERVEVSEARLVKVDESNDAQQEHRLMVVEILKCLRTLNSRLCLRDQPLSAPCCVQQ